MYDAQLEIMKKVMTHESPAIIFVVFFFNDDKNFFSLQNTHNDTGILYSSFI